VKQLFFNNKINGNEAQQQKIKKIRRNGGGTFLGGRNLIEKYRNLSKTGGYQYKNNKLININII
jgi:hypothetical protein